MELDDTIQSTSETTSETSTDSSPSISEAVSAAYDSVTEQNAAPSQDSRRSENTAPKDTEAPLDWDSLDPRAKKAYETTEKRWKDTQSYLTKQQQEWKAKEARWKELEEGSTNFSRFDKLYNSNPKVQAAINEALGIKSNVDPDLANDPLYQYLEKHQTTLNQQLEPVFRFVKEQQERERASAIEQEVEKVTQAATNRFKALMGRDPSEQEIAKIYNHMVEKKTYDGESAAVSAFFDDIVNARVQAALGDQMKKKQVGTRTSSVNSGKAKTAVDYESKGIRDFVSEALEGIGIQ